MKFSDLTGRCFGKWKVLGRAANKGRQPSWLCRCECGKVNSVIGFTLRNGESLSCGGKTCADRSTPKTTHGESSRGSRVRPSREYKTWESMLGRCYRVSDPSYPHYGAKGIVVCKKWRASYPDSNRNKTTTNPKLREKITALQIPFAN